jgi:hypothetical protein
MLAQGSQRSLFRPDLGLNLPIQFARQVFIPAANGVSGSTSQLRDQTQMLLHAADEFLLLEA